jgi:hypothetical protein
VNTFVEVQLWSDDPVRHLLCDRGYGPSPGG